MQQSKTSFYLLRADARLAPSNSFPFAVAHPIIELSVFTQSTAAICDSVIAAREPELTTRVICLAGKKRNRSYRSPNSHQTEPVITQKIRACFYERYRRPLILFTTDVATDTYIVCAVITHFLPQQDPSLSAYAKIHCLHQECTVSTLFHAYATVLTVTFQPQDEQTSWQQGGRRGWTIDPPSATSCSVNIILTSFLFHCERNV